MKWISFFVCVWAAVCCAISRADAPPSYHLQHPLSTMHGLPSGEQPGWNKSWWFNFEISNGNIWNAPLTMIDKRNGNQYDYTADFEQNNLYIEFGGALSKFFALSLEVPIVEKSGGIMDAVIDDFHLLINNFRFNRQYYPKNQNIFSVKTNNVEYYTNDNTENGIGNLKLKLKWWFLQWFGFDEGSCPCGVSLSSQTKFSVQDKKQANTTGGIDQSLLLHIGVPFFDSSAMWFTGGYTWLSEMPAMKGWPRYNQSQFYELNIDLGLTEKWGLLLGARAESPFLKRDDLDYFDTTANAKVRAENRVASGWNSLVYWRGSESLGLRYRSLSGNQWQVLIVEDWGIGSQDSADGRYTNDAPDVEFVLQMNLNW